MESKSIMWEIEYKIAGRDRINTMKISLHFNKLKNIEKWFRMAYNGTNGKKHYEFINAKIVEL